ncbi:MAG: hypothetical protein WCG47_25330 [Dermatophilaceae bacterium]
MACSSRCSSARSTLRTVIKPVLTFFGAPLIWLTLGLSAWSSTPGCCSSRPGWPAGSGWPPRRGFWWSAVWGALVITIVSMVINVLLPDREHVYH